MDHLESILSAPDPREIGRLVEAARRALAHAWAADVTLYLHDPIRAAKGDGDTLCCCATSTAQTGLRRWWWSKPPPSGTTPYSMNGLSSSG